MGKKILLGCMLSGLAACHLARVGVELAPSDQGLQGVGAVFMVSSETWQKILASTLVALGIGIIIRMLIRRRR